MRYMLAVLFLITAMTPVAAHACSCVSPGTVEQEKAQSTRVFLGRVTAIEERTPQMDKGWLTVIAEWITRFFGAEAPPTDRDFPYKRVIFTVTETFKGIAAEEIELATGTGGGDCGYPFVTGEEYVVYAHGKEDALGAGICSLTGPASDPKSGLAALRDGS